MELNTLHTAISTRRTSLSDVLAWASEYTGVHVKRIRSKERTREVVMARQLYMLVARTILEHRMSLSTVASEVNRDHATCIHGVRTQMDLLDTLPAYRPYVREFMQLIRAQLSPIEQHNLDLFCDKITPKQ